jgi:hypothetical protein
LWNPVPPTLKGLQHPTETVLLFQVQVFCFVTPCIVVAGYQSFRGPCCLHHPEDVGSIDLPEDLDLNIIAVKA